MPQLRFDDATHHREGHDGPVIQAAAELFSEGVAKETRRRRHNLTKLYESTTEFLADTSQGRSQRGDIKDTPTAPKEATKQYWPNVTND